jgi:hypothetical protein
MGVSQPRTQDTTRHFGTVLGAILKGGLANRSKKIRKPQHETDDKKGHLFAV